MSQATSWLLITLVWCIRGSFAIPKFLNGTKSLNRPFVETYWESYLSYPYEPSSCYPDNLEGNNVNEEAFGYDLRQIPTENIDVVNIAFLSADHYDTFPCDLRSGCTAYYCGLHLFQKSDDSDLQRVEKLKSDIQYLQSTGVLVKLALGGEEYGNTAWSSSKRTRYTITYDAERIAKIVAELGADGVDLTQNNGYGDSMMVNNDESSSQLMFLHHLRQSMPADKIISYTFPVDDKYGPGAGQEINFPYRDIIRYGQNYVDTFNVYRATYKSMREMMEDFSVDPSKIVWGLAIGCNDGPYAPTNVDLPKAIETAEYVKAYEMAGVMTWSINRDTNHRVEPIGVCDDLQAGYEDGTYLKTIHEALKN